MSPRSLLRAALAAVSVATLLATPAATEPDTAPCAGCNLLLISLDTLRADHMSCYGHVRDTTPALCAFFADGVRFERAISQAPWTAPAHASMFTGRLPTAHGVVEGPFPAALRPETPTLFSILGERGYATLAIHGGAYMKPALPHDAIGHAEVIPLMRNRGVIPRVETALARVPEGKPWFLFLHAYDPHTHYKPRKNHFARRNRAIDRQASGEGYCEYEDLPDGSRRLDPARIPRDPAVWQYIETLYDSEIYEADRALGKLFARLGRAGLLERTVVAFTSDHGEEFNEHGSCEHVKTLYEEVLHVPLLIRWPGSEARVDPRRVPASTGLAPTLLELLGVSTDVPFDAPSLLDPTRDPGPVVAETRFHYDGERLRLFSASQGRWKWITRTGRESTLYDLASDPAERRGSPAGGGAEPTALRAALDRYVASAGETPDAPPGSIDCETAKRLHALGYIGEEAVAEHCE